MEDRDRYKKQFKGLEKLSALSEDRRHAIIKCLEIIRNPDLTGEQVHEISISNKDNRVDAYYAALALVIEDNWEFAKDKLPASPEVNFTEKGFKHDILATYIPIFNDLSEGYRHGILDKVEEDTTMEDDASRKALNNVLVSLFDSNGPEQGALTVSIRDMIHAVFNIAELVDGLCGGDPELFEVVMKSKSVRYFINLLMMNDGNSFLEFCDTVGTDPYHKKLSFKYKTELFNIKNGQLIVHPELISAIRRLFEEDKVGYQQARRGCPASFVPKSAMDGYFQYLVDQVALQYKKYIAQKA